MVESIEVRTDSKAAVFCCACGSEEREVKRWRREVLEVDSELDCELDGGGETWESEPCSSSIEDVEFSLLW